MDISVTTTGAAPVQRSKGLENENYGIVAFSHLRWNFVWQRPQQFLSRFALKHPVLFIEEPDFRLADGEEPILHIERSGKNVTVATVSLSGSLRGSEKVGPLMLHYARMAIESVNEDGRFDNPLLWYYSPMEAAWSLGEIDGRAVVYDCMDELSQFAGAPPELIENERRLIEQADIVFTGGYELYLKKAKQHPHVHFFGCGVEYDHFSKAQNESTEIPEDVKNIGQPRIGWFGVVDERVDYPLLKRMAELRPDWNFVIVGPVVKVDPNSLPQAPNLHWLGGRDYKVLPNYCRAYDVCMMCFAINDATEFINPTKALEYLATGKPVVSTPVRDVVRQYADTVQIATTPEDFVACIERALTNPDQEMIRRGAEKAQQASWECTVERMQELIDEAVEAKAAPAFLS